MTRHTPIAVSISAAMLLLATNISAQHAYSEHDAQNADPVTRLWLELKKQLTSDKGQNYFQGNVEDSELPPLAGKLLSATPHEQPNILTLSMPGSDRPEVTLILKDKDGKDSHMPGPLVLGSSVTFQGVGVSFTQEPFMLVFEVSTNPRVTTPRQSWRPIILGQPPPKSK